MTKATVSRLMPNLTARKDQTSTMDSIYKPQSRKPVKFMLLQQQIDDIKIYPKLTYCMTLMSALIVSFEGGGGVLQHKSNSLLLNAVVLMG